MYILFFSIHRIYTPHIYTTEILVGVGRVVMVVVGVHQVEYIALYRTLTINAVKKQRPVRWRGVHYRWTIHYENLLHALNFMKRMHYANPAMFGRMMNYDEDEDCTGNNCNYPKIGVHRHLQYKMMKWRIPSDILTCTKCSVQCHQGNSSPQSWESNRDPPFDQRPIEID